MKPTYLYIKQHSITGLLYFGKTVYDPETYKGSGKYWKKHIKKHGIEHVVNLWYCLFYDQDELTKFATQFSSLCNIAESVEWANLCGENGLDGAPTGDLHIMKGKTLSDEHKRKIGDSVRGVKNGFFGRTHTDDVKRKISEHRTGTKLSDATLKKISEANTGKLHSVESKKKISESNVGRKWSEESRTNLVRPKKPCPHCGRSFTPATMARYHGDRCKERAIGPL